MSPAVVFFLYMLCGNIFEIREEVSKTFLEFVKKWVKTFLKFVKK